MREINDQDDVQIDYEGPIKVILPSGVNFQLDAYLLINKVYFW